MTLDRSMQRTSSAFSATSPAVRLVTIAALAAGALVAGCNRADNQTAGEKLDTAIASADRKADEIKSDVKQGASEVRAATSAAADRMSDRVDAAKDQLSTKVDDAAITAAVNAELAKDSRLSALRINVDTAGGHVLLKGTAPDTATRERATELAASVKGVASVDNQLIVRG